MNPPTRGFKRLQAQTAEDALREPLDGGDGETRLEAIHAEWLADWHARDIAQGGEHRRAILEPIAGLLDGPPPAIDPDAAHTAVAPAIWLLELGVDGIALTQTGAINRATVRDAAERWPGWWDGGLHGPPHQEADVILLSELHEQLRDLKLLRRSGRRLLTTNRGRGLATEPAQLISALAGDLLAGNDFRAACAELSVALLLTGFDADWSDPLAQAIGPAIVEGGWRSNGDSPSTRDISWTISDFIRPATAAGLLEIRELAARRRDPLILTAAGRLALITALRNRATGPRRSPY